MGNVKEVILGGEKYEVDFSFGELIVKDFDIENEEIAETLAGVFPGRAVFFKIASRHLRQKGLEEFSKDWEKMTFQPSWGYTAGYPGPTYSPLVFAYSFCNKGHIPYMARNSNCPHEIKEVLLRSPALDNILAVFYGTNRKVSSRFIEKVYSLFDGALYETVVSNKSTPSHILEKIAKVSLLDQNKQRQLWREIASHANAPSHLLEEFAKNPRLQVRVAANKNTPPQVLALLAKSNNNSTVFNVASNPSTPSETLRQLRNVAGIYRHLLQNPNLGDDLIVDIVRERQRKSAMSGKEIEI